MTTSASPESLLQSIYLGDRACKGISINTWARRVAIQVDVISRLKPGSNAWDFYSDGDIQDGLLVFVDVCSVRFDPSGPLPNDLINSISVETIPGGAIRLFEVSIGSIDGAGGTTEVRVLIEATSVHLEDPKRPGLEIR
jgi:hypothetical protein